MNYRNFDETIRVTKSLSELSHLNIYSNPEREYQIRYDTF